MEKANQFKSIKDRVQTSQNKSVKTETDYDPLFEREFNSGMVDMSEFFNRPEKGFNICPLYR